MYQLTLRWNQSGSLSFHGIICRGLPSTSCCGRESILDMVILVVVCVCRDKDSYSCLPSVRGGDALRDTAAVCRVEGALVEGPALSPLSPALDVVLLLHEHLDHSGRHAVEVALLGVELAQLPQEGDVVH